MGVLQNKKRTVSSRGRTRNYLSQFDNTAFLRQREEEEQLRRQAEEVNKNKKLSKFHRLMALLQTGETGHAYHEADRYADEKNAKSPIRTGISLLKHVPGLNSLKVADKALEYYDKAKGKPKKKIDPKVIEKYLTEYGKSTVKTAKVAVTGRDKDQWMANRKYYSDVLARKGMTQRKGKVDVADVLGLGLDIGLDPTTYVTFGTGAGAKSVVAGGSKVILNRTGRKALEQAIEEGAKKGATRKQVTEAFVRIASKSPEYQAKTGARFAGQTIVPQKAFDKVGLREVGERGLIMGSKDAALKGAEKIPVLGRGVGATRTAFRELIDTKYSKGFHKIEGGEAVQEAMERFEQKTKGDAISIATAMVKARKRAKKAGYNIDSFANTIEYKPKGTKGTKLEGRLFSDSAEIVHNPEFVHKNKFKNLAEEVPEEGYLRDINRVVRKYNKDQKYHIGADGDLKVSTNILEDHFDELSPKTQRYLEFEAPGIDNESITIPRYRGFASADPHSSGRRVHGSQLIGLEDFVDDISTKRAKSLAEMSTGERLSVKKRSFEQVADSLQKTLDKRFKAGKITPEQYKNAIIALGDLRKASGEDVGRLNKELRDVLPDLMNRYGINAFDPLRTGSVVETSINLKKLSEKLGRELTRPEKAAILKSALRSKKKLAEAVEVAAKAYRHEMNKMGRAMTTAEAKSHVNKLFRDLEITKKIEPKLKPDTGIYNKIENLLKDTFGKVYEEEFKRGIQVVGRESYAPHILTDEAKKLIVKGKFDDDTVRLFLKSTKSKFSKQRNMEGTIKLLNKEWRKTHDFDLFETDIFRAGAERMIESSKKMNFYDMTQEIARDFGLPDLKKKVTKFNEFGDEVTEMVSEKVTKDGVDYTRVMITDKSGNVVPMREFEGVLLPRQIADEMTANYAKMFNPKEINRFLHIYDKGLSAFKMSVTSIFWAFHARNLQGGAFNNYLAGVYDPTLYATGEKIVRGGSGNLKLKDGKVISFDKIRTEARARGIVNQTGVIDFNRMLDDLKGIPKKDTKLKIKQAPRKATEEIEAFLRMPLFINELKKGNSFEGAAEQVMKYHFDYGRAAHTKFENEAMRRLIPFYVWTRHNIPLQLEQMGKQPGKYSAVTKIMEGEDRSTYHKEKAMMPEWMTSRTNFRTPTGKYAFVELPWNDIMRLGSAGEMLGMLTPAKMAIEQAANYDFFRQEKIRGDKVDGEYPKKTGGKLLSSIPYVGKLLDVETDKYGNTKMDPTLQHIIYGAFGRITRSLEEMVPKDAKKDKKTFIQTITQPEFLSKNLAGTALRDPKLYFASEFRKSILEKMSSVKQKEYATLHLDRDGSPLLSTDRKAAMYIDNPDFFYLDKMYYKMKKEMTGQNYDPVYDLPWENAKKYYAQQTKGDAWNADELEKQPWYTTLRDDRNEYFDGFEDSDYESEASKYYKEPSAYVKIKMSMEDWDDPQVKAWLEENTRLKNEKRRAIGLITDEPQQTIRGNISDAHSAFKEQTGKSLIYMQIMRMAGLGYEDWFAEHPDLDPLNGAEIKGLSKYKPYTRKPRKYSGKVKYPSDAKKKVSKSKVIKLGTVRRKSINPKNVKQWTRY